MPLDKYNAQMRCHHCRKFRWGYMDDPGGSPTTFLCGTCEEVTYL